MRLDLVAQQQGALGAYQKLKGQLREELQECQAQRQEIYDLRVNIRDAEQLEFNIKQLGIRYKVLTDHSVRQYEDILQLRLHLNRREKEL